MKIAIDLAEGQLKAIDRIASNRRCARDAVIQNAIAIYIREHHRQVMNAAFGIWGKLEIDSLEYQRQLRAEWDS